MTSPGTRRTSGTSQTSPSTFRDLGPSPGELREQLTWTWQTGGQAICVLIASVFRQNLQVGESAIQGHLLRPRRIVRGPQRPLRLQRGQEADRVQAGLGPQRRHLGHCDGLADWHSSREGWIDLYSVLCSMYSAILYSALCTLYYLIFSLYCFLYSLICTVLCTLYSVINQYSSLCSLH